VALIALLLMLLVPMYTAVRRASTASGCSGQSPRSSRATCCCSGPPQRGPAIAFPFFVWVSIFGVMVIAQLWAFAADSFNLKSGQRLFPVIMLGANLGALAGQSRRSWPCPR